MLGIFMQIAIRHEDQSALRFLWSNEETIIQYHFTRLFSEQLATPFVGFLLNCWAEDKAIQYLKQVL